MQSSSEQPLVGEEHCVTTLITAAKETKSTHVFGKCDQLTSYSSILFLEHLPETSLNFLIQ